MALTATGSQHSMGAIEETVYGTTDSTPVFKDVRHTSASLALTKSELESAELRNDRQIANYRHGNKSVAGDIGIELSYTSFDDFLEAALGGTWDIDAPSAGIDELKVGLTRRSFTLERLFAGIAVPEYHRYTGAEITSLNLSIEPDSIITGSFSFLAQDHSIGTAILSGATYPAATTTEPFTSFGGGSILEGGSAIGSVTGIELTLENGLNPLFVVGSDITEQPSIGKSRVTGTLTTFFQSKALLDKFIAETASSLEFTLTDPAGNTLYFHLPNIKYNGGQPDVEGDGEVTIALPFVALYDVTEVSNMVIQRNPI